MSSAPTSSSAASPTGFSGTGTKREVSGARELPSPPAEEEEEATAAAGRRRAAAPPWRGTSPARAGSRSSGHAHRLIGSEGQRRRRGLGASSTRDEAAAHAQHRPHSGGGAPSSAPFVAGEAEGKGAEPINKDKPDVSENTAVLIIQIAAQYVFRLLYMVAQSEAG